MAIQGFLRPRLARLGKIRLGKKAISAKSGNEYPSDLPSFRVPEEVAAVYGEDPNELDVMVPSCSFDEFCPIELQRWGADERKLCHSKDGETALRWSDGIGGWEEVPCAYKDCPFYGKGKGQGCDERGNLMLILPRVSLGGVYQIDTGSRNGLNNLLSEFTTFQTILNNLTGNGDMVRAVVFRLTRELETLHYVEGGVRKPVEKYILHLRAPNLSIEKAQQLAAQFRGNAGGPLLGDGQAVIMPSLGSGSDDERVLPALPPVAELPEVPDECPNDLVAGASPVGPSLGQKTAFAALMEQVNNLAERMTIAAPSTADAMAKRRANFESSLARAINKQASKFDDLEGETEAVEALKRAEAAVIFWQEECEAEEALGGQQAAPEPEAEPEPVQHADPTAGATTQVRNQRADGNLGF